MSPRKRGRLLAGKNRLVGETIRERSAELASVLVAEKFSHQGKLESRCGNIGLTKALQDAQDQLNYLADAVEMDSPSLFRDFVTWAQVVFASRGAPEEDLAFQLDMMQRAMRSVLPVHMQSLACEFVEAARSALPAFNASVPTFLADDAPHGSLAREYLKALLKGRRHEASRMVLDAVEQGADVRDVYLHVFQPTQYEIGRLWQLNEINVAQEHYCTAATQLVMSQLYPKIFRGAKSAGSMVATCVAGDLHEIGIRMIADFFELEGWNTYYLGASTPHDDVIEAVLANRATVLCISATISYHVHEVRKLIDAVKEQPDCHNVVILVGGYPFNAALELWEKVGADGCSHDAAQAVALARQLKAS